MDIPCTWANILGGGSFAYQVKLVFCPMAHGFASKGTLTFGSCLPLLLLKITPPPPANKRGILFKKNILSHPYLGMPMAHDAHDCFISLGIPLGHSQTVATKQPFPTPCFLSALAKTSPNFWFARKKKEVQTQKARPGTQGVRPYKDTSQNLKPRRGRPGFEEPRRQGGSGGRVDEAKVQVLHAQLLEAQLNGLRSQVQRSHAVTPKPPCRFV